MKIQVYNKTHPEISKSWENWHDAIDPLNFGEEGFEEKVGVKITEEPENPNYYFDQFDHYMILGSFKKALGIINTVIEKFPELKDYAETLKDKELYVSEDATEERIEFREFFSSREELSSVRYLLGGTEEKLGYISPELINKLNELIYLNPGNLLYLSRLWHFYIRRFELDKAKEVALKMVAADKYYERYLNVLDINNTTYAREIYSEISNYGDKTIVTKEIKIKYKLDGWGL